jgi:heme-degrading monooxygenase HmoA
MKIAKTPPPPYYAAIATTIRTSIEDGYNEMADAMEELVIEQQGYLGHEFARDGIGINVSYWETIEDIKKWKYLEEHLVAQKLGKEKWYQSYKVRICKVERDYEFTNTHELIK